MKKRCVIVAGGDCFLSETELITESDFVIAADSGLNILLETGHRPNLVVGDFDSFSGTVPGDIEIIKLPVQKDDTDLLFAARTGVERGFFDFLILGGYGSRPDHNFAMYSTLLWLASNYPKTKAMAVSKDLSVTVISNSSAEFEVETDEYFSVFAFGKEALGVTIKGADYELTDAVLTADFPVGVSNCNSNGGPVSVSVKNGNLLIFKLKKNI